MDIVPIPQMRRQRLAEVELKFQFQLEFVGSQVCRLHALFLVSLANQKLFFHLVTLEALEKEPPPSSERSP